ncbi:hypothetical protein G6O69_02205 [Pseudenhygromyxa sp. WMMC2535]|uniref:hypothetical protein n=1 Tax=Pseudenhygromyxa sp. WMMC2535 TaxID=2712867 RepID=UPI0015557682|nr:hypothetical protein [Pseudenhygromyxa sp. WMMC2535]NVB36628.1 hypothetical protein [Pseudenhygromyxa sp. WMMC2535]
MVDSSTEKKSCRGPVGDEVFRTDLIDGFGVPELSSTLEEVKLVEGSEGAEIVGYELEWTAPEESVLVTCALFTCPPVFDVSGSVVDIANFDRCVSALSYTSETAGTFSPGDSENAYIPGADAYAALAPGCPLPDSGDNPREGQAVTALLVGCWAYDEWSLIRASKLYYVGSEFVIDTNESLARGVDGDCLDDDVGEGRSCVLEIRDGLVAFGVCVDATEDASDDMGTSTGTDTDSGSETDSEGAGTTTDTGDDEESAGSVQRCAQRCTSKKDCEERCALLGEVDAEPSCMKEAGADDDVLGYCTPCTE